MLKIFMISMLVGFPSSFVYAHEKGGSFQDQKKESLQMVDEQSVALQAAKTCFTAAKDNDAIEKCHKDLWKSAKKCKTECKKCHKDKKEESEKEDD